jgi:hypothetical protein
VHRRRAWPRAGRLRSFAQARGVGGHRGSFAQAGGMVVAGRLGFICLLRGHGRRGELGVGGESGPQAAWTLALRISPTASPERLSICERPSSFCSQPAPVAFSTEWAVSHVLRMVSACVREFMHRVDAGARLAFCVISLKVLFAEECPLACTPHGRVRNDFRWVGGYTRPRYVRVSGRRQSTSRPVVERRFYR